MRIVIDPGTPSCRNMGDVAMLQVAVARLREAWPDDAVSVLTTDGARLARYCPGAIPVPEAGRRAWCADQHTTTSDLLHPHAAGPSLKGRLRRVMRRIFQEGPADGPAPRPYAAIRAFLQFMREAELHVVCGQATLTDCDPAHAVRLLDTVALSLKRNVPVVMMGQGIGPLSDPGLLQRAREVLPRLRLIAIREERGARALLRSIGVRPERIMLTGDDAVEPAWRARPDRLGDGLGIHLRVAPLALASGATVTAIGELLRTASRELGAPLVPLPISHHINGGAYDPEVLEKVLLDQSRYLDGGAAIDTPARVIAAAGTCRVVVTCGYHPAAFALSQGIPTVCLGRSAYYFLKFRGLRDLFGPGCVVLDLEAADFPAQLASSIRDAWARAEKLREPLLAAAFRQVRQGRAAYARVIAALTRPSDELILQAGPAGGSLARPALEYRSRPQAVDADDVVASRAACSGPHQ